MDRDERIREVQRLYPLLYFACHGSHGREDGLSESALRLLHHVDGRAGILASELARHLDLSRSRLSEALTSLERAGLIRRESEGGGRKPIHLTPRGEATLESSDGLNPRAIGAVLDRLSPAEQERVLDGLRLLADAAREPGP